MVSTFLNLVPAKIIDFISKYFKRRVDGYVDILAANQISGWIKRRADDTPAVVDIFLNDFCIGRGIVANLMRPDLKDAGYGTGCHGFEIQFDVMSFRSNNITASIHLEGEKKPSISRRFRIKTPRLSANTAVFPRNSIGSESYTASRSIRLTLASGKEVNYIYCVENFDLSEIRGWIVEQDDVQSDIVIEIFVDDVFYVGINNDKPRIDANNILYFHNGGFSAKLNLKMLDFGSHCVEIKVFGSVIYIYNFHINESYSRNCIKNYDEGENGITIVVPIYNAANDLRRCIAALENNTPESIEILLIDDCSTDPEIEDIVQLALRSPRIRALKHKENLGFTKSINHGFVEAGQNDVIILNSDSRVTPGWVEGMRRAARSGPRIATVTAMSDRAGAFSAPTMGNDNYMPDGVDECVYARSFRRRSLGLYPTVPTGNGFCMYVNRACLSEIGSFDAEAFPRGYGEENDFCMRAVRAGWRNLIDDRTYVFHGRSKSFGAARTGLIASGRAVIDARYPEYTHAIQIFSSSEKINLARFRARQALQDCLDRPMPPTRILFVTSSQSGGTPQTNIDLMNALSDSFDCWNLRCDSRILELTRYAGRQSEIICVHVLEEPVDPLTHRSREYDNVVSEWLFRFDFDLIHIRHLALHSLSLPSLVKRLGKKVIFSFHDFYTLSPTIKLIDDLGAFLGDHFEPEASKFRETLWPPGSQPTPSGEWLRLWRTRFQQELLLCDAFVTTSESARRLIATVMEELPAGRMSVIPHGRDFRSFYRLRESMQRGRPVRILVPGNINPAKGLDIICTLAEYDKEGLLEFHVLGHINYGNLRPNPKIFDHGRYERDDFAEKVGAIGVNIGAIFSIWDETYCHTLTELWSVGLPALVFDFPTVATRVRQSGAGWVLDHRDIPALYERIIQLSLDEAEQRAADAALANWQISHGVRNTTRVMASRYLDVYRDVLRGYDRTGTKARIAVVCQSEPDLKRANASTHIRVWERTLNSIERNLTYIRMAPQTLIASLEEGGVDGAIIQRTAVPSETVANLLRAFQESGTPYLFDLDDDLINVPPDKDSEGAYADYAPALRELISNAALVTAPTSPLLDVIRPINTRVALLPNLLSDRLWRSPPSQRVADGTVRALYMGTVTHHADLMLIMPALEAVAAAYPEFRLMVIGGTLETIATPDRARWLEHIHPPDKAQPYDTFVPWLRKQAQRLDFALAPLEDSNFNASKSPLKILEYAALDLPILASDLDAYREIAISAPVATLIPNDVAAWEAALGRQIALGQQNADAALSNHRWALEKHALEGSLTAFDTLITGRLVKHNTDEGGIASGPRLTE